MKKYLCFLLAAMCLLAGCKAAPPAETVGTTQPPATTAPAVPETTAPTAPTEPVEMQTVWVWTKQTYTSAEGGGSVYTRTYDSLGNLTTDDYVSGDGKANSGFSYSYDAAGRIQTQISYEKFDNQNLTCMTEFTYDSADRVVKEVYADNQSNSGQVEYTYREDGQLAELVLTQGNTVDKTLYTYDENGRLLKQERTVTNRDKVTFSSIVDHAYDEAGNKLSETDDRGAQKLWTYDENGNVLTYQQLDGNGYQLEGVVYEYDEAGRVFLEYPCEGDLKTPERKYIYEYDETGRLAVKYICTPNSNRINASQVIRYTYDENGNLLSEICTDKKNKEVSRREYTYISMEIPVK